VPIAGERCKEDGTGVKRDDAGGGRRKKRRVEKNERWDMRTLENVNVPRKSV
jgi:hypothetical protein